MGKTAIYKYLEKSEPQAVKNNIVVALNFQDYPWPAHKLYKDSISGELSAYQKSWCFLFFVKLISKLIDIKETNSESLSKPDPSVVEVLFSKLARIKKIAGPSAEIDEINFNVGEISLTPSAHRGN